MNQPHLGLVWGTWLAELIGGLWKVCLLARELCLQPGVKIVRLLSKLFCVHSGKGKALALSVCRTKDQKSKTNLDDRENDSTFKYLTYLT